jgi:arylsulfatase
MPYPESCLRRAGCAALLAISALAFAPPGLAQAPAKKPNILVIFGDDVGQTNLSAYSFGLMGYTTPNIDRIAHEGTMFTDYYAENSCTAGRSSFITGQRPSAPVCRRWEFPAHRSVFRHATSRLRRR